MKTLEKGFPKLLFREFSVSIEDFCVDWGFNSQHFFCEKNSEFHAFAAKKVLTEVA